MLEIKAARKAAFWCILHQKQSEGIQFFNFIFQG